ncbi:UGMP family protein [Candidatus Pacearchaeota archaeon]|nr:UGMP family protein [Candidatus Pacearchaeota archaeon]
MVIILGIESTAHTFGIGIVRDGKILSNLKKTYTTEEGGIIPMDAAKHHFENKNKIYFEALDKSGIKEGDIDAISFSQGPGLAPCLLEGMKFAKELSMRLEKPIVPVNHCIAHLEIGTHQGCTPNQVGLKEDFRKKSLLGAKLTGARDPVMLYASGANTQIIAYASGKYRIFGETLDIGVGNFIDNFARYAGIGFPGGPKIEELARGETPQAYPEKSSAKIFTNGKNYIELPYKVKGMDITLSGILTNLRQKFESKRYPLNDLSYSLQETVFAMLVETAERALAHTGKKELLLGGGVACNSRLQEMCKIMCEERGAKFFCPEKSLLVDNGAMIAFLGEILFKNGIKFSHKELDSIDIKPRQRTDDVEVSWK